MKDYNKLECFILYMCVFTLQYSLGLFDCNENKTQEVIRLLKDLTEKYVPVKDGEISEEVFFGGESILILMYCYIYDSII
jgi:hypothetical protein